MGRAGRAGERAGNLSCAPTPAPQPGVLPVPSILILPPGSHQAPPHSLMVGVPMGGAPGPRPSRGRGSWRNEIPGCSLNTEHWGNITKGCRGREVAEPHRKAAVSVYRGSRACKPTQEGGRELGLPPLPPLGTKPGSTRLPGQGPPSPTPDCCSASQTWLAPTPCNTFGSQSPSHGWGQPGCSTAPEMCTAPSSGG